MRSDPIGIGPRRALAYEARESRPVRLAWKPRRHDPLQEREVKEHPEERRRVAEKHELSLERTEERVAARVSSRDAHGSGGQLRVSLRTRDTSPRLGKGRHVTRRCNCRTG